MGRTKLKDRMLPLYTRGEEIMNMTTHIVGGAFGIVAVVLCAVFGALHHNKGGVVGGVLFGSSIIFLYTISAIYHGLIPEMAKKVFQVLDHCTIYALIAGTYMPILLTGIKENYPKLFITYMIMVPLLTAVGVTFTAIDFHRYAIIAMGSYFVIGWSAIFIIVPIIKSFGLPFFLWLVGGGIVYTLGMIFFKLGMTKKYYHSIFHLFILGGTALQFTGIFIYCICR